MSFEGGEHVSPCKGEYNSGGCLVVAANTGEVVVSDLYGVQRRSVG